MSKVMWMYCLPLGAAIRSIIGTSPTLRTYGRLLRKCFLYPKRMLEKNNSFERDAEYRQSYSLKPRSRASPGGSTCTSTKVDAQTQTDYSSHPLSKVATETGLPSDLQPQLSCPGSQSNCPISTPTELASPISVFSIDDDELEYVEYTMVASNIPEPVKRTPMQDFALTDLLAIVILPAYVETKFEDTDEELEFRHRIGIVLKEYEPLTSAIFLGLSFMERLRNRINTVYSFYWWFMLCLLYAHQMLDDFGTITVKEVQDFMNVDASFVKRRQTNGYKALEHELNVSQVDWVYFLNYIRLRVISGLSPASAEAISQLISLSLPIQGDSPKDEVRLPLQLLEMALEKDRRDVERCSGEGLEEINT